MGDVARRVFRWGGWERLPDSDRAKVANQKLNQKRQPMKDSQDFDFSASPSLASLKAFVKRQLSLSAEEATQRQPDFEEGLRRLTMGLEREIHQAVFEYLDVDVDGIVVDGVRYRNKGEKTLGVYDTLSGDVDVMRSTYIERGEGRRSVCPLEMRLGIVRGRWTPAAAKLASGFMASVPSSEARRLLESTGTMKPSSAHLDRLPKEVERVWEAGREEFEIQVRKAEVKRLPTAETVAVVLISLDGIMLPMKDAPRTPGAGKEDKGPKGHKEASSGTLALLDARGERLHTIYLGRMPESRKLTLRAQLKAELAALLKRYPDAALQAVADGAEENWRIVTEIEEELGVSIERVLDFFHAVQHLNEGLRRYAGSSKEQAAEDIKFWSAVLRDSDKGAKRAREALRYRMNKAQTDRLREDIAKEFRYFSNHFQMMKYPELRARHRPIGSGIQEAACKTLIAQRMKCSGMSWRRPGGQGILLLRSLVQSRMMPGRFSGLLSELSSRWTRTRGALNRGGWQPEELCCGEVERGLFPSYISHAGWAPIPFTLFRRPDDRNQGLGKSPPADKT